MYKSFFGLKKNPFNVNPDPRYLYLTPAMRQALDELTYGIQHRKGLMTLTGEVGTGKTTLVNHLLSWLEHQRARTAFIFNSHLDSKQMFDFILSDFEVPLTPATRDNPLLAFNEWLVARNKARELVVLIVDEAQGLPTHVLEDIRLLQNMETPDEKLLQIVLSGQPELEIKLKRPDLVQLQQRIALRCKTAPLTLPETYGYIEDRLNTAGAGGKTVFLPEAVEAVYLYSRGIPRVINLLCENSLIAAYADHERPIPAGIVEEAARDLQFDEMRPVAPRLKAIDGASSANDLHSLLARIEASAIHVDRADRGVSTARVSPFLVTAENAASRREQIAASSTTPAQVSNQNAAQARESGYAARKPAVLSAAPGSIQRIANTSAGKRIGNHADSGAANLREVLRRIKKADFHSTISSTRDGLRDAFRKAELKKRAIRSANALRLGIIKGRAFVLVVAVPQTKIHASNAGKSARSWSAWTVNWWKQNLNDHKAANTFIVTAGILSVLYFAVRGINPLHSWQRSGLTALGFVSALLFVTALSLALTMFIAKRTKSLRYRSGMASSAVRWLKAPMHASQIRAFGTIAGKAQSHRRL